MFQTRCRILARLFRDQRGSTVSEYMLVVGLIVVTAIAVIGYAGTRMVARWSYVNQKLDPTARAAVVVSDPAKNGNK